ncbi:MAG: DUF3575 domain-containing protein [Alistipes sp.]|jgi:hypothetical protein|nr:DUF3575 domain-containing protein [Alistipes sp.]
MKRKLFLIALGLVLLAGTERVHGQVAVKINAPFLLVGSPNVGAEVTLSQQFTLNGDVMWMPYMFKKNKEVFRALQTSVDLRWYPSPRYYYTNGMFDGFYVGPYTMWGNFNIGLATHDDPMDDTRFKGWGVSAGASVGYKFYLSRHFRLDINMGVGFAHLQYDRLYLGDLEWEYAPGFKEVKATKWWIGPTKFGVHLVYNIFR